MRNKDYLEDVCELLHVPDSYILGQVSKSSIRFECKHSPFVITCRKGGIVDVEGYKFCKRYTCSNLYSYVRTVHACFESYK